MDRDTCISICQSLSKAYSTGARYVEDGNICFYCSAADIHPDPAGPFLHEIFCSKAQAGIIATPLYQLYGFLRVSDAQYVILGPTRIQKENSREMKSMMAQIGVDEWEYENYVRKLNSAPIIHADRFAWLLASLMTIISDQPFPVENVWFPGRMKSSWNTLKSMMVKQEMETEDDMDISWAVLRRHAWEQLLLSYVENGRVDQLVELFHAPPDIRTGKIAEDGLRQAKNTGICTAAVVSRAAIQGGMNPQQAFALSDLYIRRLELLNDVISVQQLIQDMILDYAQHVHDLRLPEGGGSAFYRMCTGYVSEHLFSLIRVQKMADDLGYNRSYLCSQFKQEAGISLVRYIQQEKIDEAKKLLRFSDQSLGRIAAMLGFSSQSHFQTVFRNLTGVTPMAYRNDHKVMQAQWKKHG